MTGNKHGRRAQLRTLREAARRRSNRRTAERVVRATSGATCGLNGEAQRSGSRVRQDLPTDQFCLRLRVDKAAPGYASVALAEAALDRLAARTGLPVSIFDFGGTAVYGIVRVTWGGSASQSAEAARKVERLARHHGLRLDGPVTSAPPFDLESIEALGSGIVKGGAEPASPAKAAPITGSCLCIRLPIGAGGYATETAAVEALEGFAARLSASVAAMGHPVVIGPGDAVHGVWRFVKPVPTGAWLEMADLVSQLARVHGLRLDGPMTSAPPFDLDYLQPGTLEELA